MLFKKWILELHRWSRRKVSYSTGTTNICAVTSNRNCFFWRSKLRMITSTMSLRLSSYSKSKSFCATPKSLHLFLTNSYMRTGKSQCSLIWQHNQMQFRILSLKVKDPTITRKVTTSPIKPEPSSRQVRGMKATTWSSCNWNKSNFWKPSKNAKKSTPIYLILCLFRKNRLHKSRSQLTAQR